MSKSRKELKQWIEEQTFPTMCALAVCYLYNSIDDEKTYKISDVYHAFNQMHLLRSNKLPTKRFIYKNSWCINQRFVDCAINYAINKLDKNKMRDRINLLDFQFLCMRYFDWLSEKLSQVKIISFCDVEIKLKELGF